MGQTLREDVIHGKIVMATALMAIARKVIVLDLKETEPMYLFGIAAVIISTSIGYWLVVVLPGRSATGKVKHLNIGNDKEIDNEDSK